MGNGAVFPRRSGTPAGSSSITDAASLRPVADASQSSVIPAADSWRDASCELHSTGVSAENGHPEDSQVRSREGDAATSSEYKSSVSGIIDTNSASVENSSRIADRISCSNHHSASAAEASERPTCRFCLEPGRVHVRKQNSNGNIHSSGFRRSADSTTEEIASRARGDQNGDSKENRDAEVDDDVEEDEEEDPNFLISPCQCRGTAEFVHLGCLRTWQAKVSVAAQRQPFRSPLAGRRQRGNGNGNIDNNDADDDNVGGGRGSSESRHSVCQSCQTPFTVRPLRPLQVLFRDGGPRLVACNRILRPGCLLVATKRNALPPSLISALGARGSIFPVALAALLSLRHAHWRRSVYLVVAVHPSSSSPPSSFSGSSSSNHENSQRYYRRRRSNHQDWRRSLEGAADDEIFAINLTRPVSAGASAFAASMTASEQREREQREREEEKASNGPSSSSSSSSSPSPSSSSSAPFSPSPSSRPSVSSEAFAAAMAAGAAAAEAARTSNGNTSGRGIGDSRRGSSSGGIRSSSSSSDRGVQILPYHGGPVQPKYWRIAAAVVPASLADAAAASTSTVGVAKAGAGSVGEGREAKSESYENTSPIEMPPPSSETNSSPSSSHSRFEDIFRIPLALFPTNTNPLPPPLLLSSSSSSLHASSQHQSHSYDESKAEGGSSLRNDEGKDERPRHPHSPTDAAAGNAAGARSGRRALAVGSLEEVSRLVNSACDSCENRTCSTPRTVHTFSGYAKWTRAQLLAEAARGSWGLLPSHPEPADSAAAAASSNVDANATSVAGSARSESGTGSDRNGRDTSSYSSSSGGGSSYNNQIRNNFGAIECVARYLKGENFAPLVERGSSSLDGRESPTRDWAGAEDAPTVPPHTPNRVGDVVATARSESEDRSFWATLESIALTCPAAEQMALRELATSER